nr:histidine kinase cki1 [Quercus suber]
MEATQQAERKSMNKSLAFASASHDVHASLAVLTGLIELCYEEATSSSKLETNGYLCKGPTSKIEAGKMQLDEEEFDLGQLIEDVVDLYHPIGIKKGVDVSNEAYNDLEAMNAAQQDPNVMEFVFEVDDTGKGIPKEKQISIFENYVQVKETALGQGGTGLGLGLV